MGAWSQLSLAWVGAGSQTLCCNVPAICAAASCYQVACIRSGQAGNFRSSVIATDMQPAKRSKPVLHGAENGKKPKHAETSGRAASPSMFPSSPSFLPSRVCRPSP